MHSISKSQLFVAILGLSLAIPAFSGENGLDAQREYAVNFVAGVLLRNNEFIGKKGSEHKIIYFYKNRDEAQKRTNDLQSPGSRLMPIGKLSPDQAKQWAEKIVGPRNVGSTTLFAEFGNPVDYREKLYKDVPVKGPVIDVEATNRARASGKKEALIYKPKPGVIRIDRELVNYVKEPQKIIPNVVAFDIQYLATHRDAPAGVKIFATGADRNRIIFDEKTGKRVPSKRSEWFPRDSKGDKLTLTDQWGMGQPIQAYLVKGGKGDLASPASAKKQANNLVKTLLGDWNRSRQFMVNQDSIQGKKELSMPKAKVGEIIRGEDRPYGVDWVPPGAAGGAR